MHTYAMLMVVGGNMLLYALLTAVCLVHCRFRAPSFSQPTPLPCSYALLTVPLLSLLRLHNSIPGLIGLRAFLCNAIVRCLVSAACSAMALSVQTYLLFLLSSFNLLVAR
jgi:hypothetical protein